MLRIIIAKCEQGSERETARDLISRTFGSERIERTEYGKPYFPELPELHFNISHTTGYAALAVSDQCVGVDIECLRRIKRIANKKRFAEWVFTEDERGEAYDELGFLKIWTRKEAYMKLDGRGLAILRSFSALNQNEACFIQPYFDGEALCTVAVAERKK